MKKIIRIILTFLSIIFAIGVIYFVFQPFAKSYISAPEPVGDSLMHLSNIITFKRHHSFPIKAWYSEFWAGYPVLEGYPWVHYYLIQPLLRFFPSPGVAMDNYTAAFLLVYYIASFLLLFYVGRNAFLALLFSLVLIYGAESQMSMAVNAFMTFTAGMFFLPLVLLTTIIARQKNSMKLFVVSSIILSLSFYSHGAMTGIIIIPVLLPFLLLDNGGRLSKVSILRTLEYFCLFALLSTIQIYQFISYNAQGYLRGVKPFPLSEIPARLQYLFSWQNPVLLPLLVIFIPLFFIAVRKSYSRIKPYLFSFLFLFFFFTLMVFNITSMNLVLLAERVLWALSLTFLLLFSAGVRELAEANMKWTITFSFSSLTLTAVYLYLTLVAKLPYLTPDMTKPMYPYQKEIVSEEAGESGQGKAGDKFKVMSVYPPTSWNQKFDNYRTDGISYNIYSSWAIMSANPRYKGRFPPLKGLPLEWSGLVNAAEYGLLGEAGTPDESQWAINQALFFFDWYAIRHFEIGQGDKDLASYLRKEPLVSATEESHTLTYHSLDQKYVSPIYAPVDAYTMAVISPQVQYDDFIRTLSYSEFNSQKLVPLYLGSNLSALNKGNLKYFDAVFLYGYKKSLLATNIWKILESYVREGGKLVIDTGQKVGETESINLPEVFPIEAAKMTVATKPFNLEIKENDLTKEVKKADFNPLKTKYLPYAISEAKPEALRDWAKPVLVKDGAIVLAYGQLGKGRVVWGGLNLPFHAIDNHNVSETILFANILKGFFPESPEPVKNYKALAGYEKILVKGDGGKGVLLKEHYSPAWQARLNGKSAKIYKAGLFLMYVPLGKKADFNLELRYWGEPHYWLFTGVSIITLILILIFLIFNKNIFWIVSQKFARKKTAIEDLDY